MQLESWKLWPELREDAHTVSRSHVDQTLTQKGRRLGLRQTGGDEPLSTNLGLLFKGTSGTQCQTARPGSSSGCRDWQARQPGTDSTPRAGYCSRGQEPLLQMGCHTSLLVWCIKWSLAFLFRPEQIPLSPFALPGTHSGSWSLQGNTPSDLEGWDQVKSESQMTVPHGGRKWHSGRSIWREVGLRGTRAGPCREGCHRHHRQGHWDGSKETPHRKALCLSSQSLLRTLRVCG